MPCVAWALTFTSTSTDDWRAEVGLVDLQVADIGDCSSPPAGHGRSRARSKRAGAGAER